jgi:Matrixin/FG-GAP-like repeat
MADRAVLTAGPSGEGLAIFPLNDADIFADVAFSLFGDSGGEVAARLPPAVDDEHDPFGSVAARMETAFFDSASEETAEAPAAVSFASASSESDAPSSALAGVPPVLHGQSLPERKLQSFSPLSDPTYWLMEAASDGVEPEAPGTSATGEPDSSAVVDLDFFFDGAEPQSATEPAEFKTTGGKWGPSGAFPSTGGTVTWSIAGAGWSNGSPAANWFSSTTVALSSFLSFDFTGVLTQAFAAWSAVADINFVQVADGGGNMGAGPTAMIRISGAFMDGRPASGSSTLAAAFFPATAGNPEAYAYSGDINFDSGEGSFWNQSSFLAVATHEIGHSLGLDHTTVPNSLMNAFYNPAITTPQADDIDGIRFIYGPAAAPPPPPPPAPSLWTIDGTGDFDGDGKSDLLWHNDATGATELWEMNGFALKAAQQIAAPLTQWSIAGTGDFDGDLKSDLLWHNDVTGATELWEMNGFALKAAQQIAASAWHADFI